VSSQPQRDVWFELFKPLLENVQDCPTSTQLLHTLFHSETESVRSHLDSYSRESDIVYPVGDCHTSSLSGMTLKPLLCGEYIVYTGNLP
jgi:hypothetical protein